MVNNNSLRTANNNYCKTRDGKRAEGEEEVWVGEREEERAMRTSHIWRGWFDEGGEGEGDGLENCKKSIEGLAGKEGDGKAMVRRW